MFKSDLFRKSDVLDFSSFHIKLPREILQLVKEYAKSCVNDIDHLAHLKKREKIQQGTRFFIPTLSWKPNAVYCHPVSENILYVLEGFSKLIILDLKKKCILAKKYLEMICTVLDMMH